MTSQTIQFKDELRKIREYLTQSMSSWEVMEDPPEEPTGRGFIDVLDANGKLWIVIEYRQKDGFLVSIDNQCGDEVEFPCKNAREVIKKLVDKT